MRSWSEADVRALGVTTDLVTAGSVLGLSRNAAYRLNTERRFPVPVLSLGAVYRVPVAGLLDILGLSLPNSKAATPTGAISKPPQEVR